MADQPSAARRPNFLSLRTKLLVGFTLVFSLVFAAAYYWFYTFGTQMALNMIRTDLVDTLNATIAGIDGDEFEALVKEGVPDASGVPTQDSRYARHQEWLYNAHQIESRANPYTYVKGSGEREVLWVGDIFRITSPEDGTAFLDPYTPQKDFILNGLQGLAVDMDAYTDDWGSWVSAYGPIKNSKGEVVGAVGIDFYKNYVADVQKQILNSIVLAFAITYSTLLALVFIIAQLLTRPMIRLTEAAQRIGEGDYSPDLSSLGQRGMADEISSLADNFALMVEKVSQREKSLRRQVEELKIEIDEAKRSNQVTEIVDSDFFRDLQSKADRLRLRRNGASLAAVKDALEPETEAHS